MVTNMSYTWVELLKKHTGRHNIETAWHYMDTKSMKLLKPQ